MCYMYIIQMNFSITLTKSKRNSRKPHAYSYFRSSNFSRKMLTIYLCNLYRFIVIQNHELTQTPKVVYSDFDFCSSRFAKLTKLLILRNYHPTTICCHTFKTFSVQTFVGKSVLIVGSNILKLSGEFLPIFGL